MTYLLIANAYPNKNRIYSNAFVHRRVKAYMDQGIDVEVVVMSTKVTLDEYYDGVKIKYLDEYQLANLMNSKQYEGILIHFINHKMYYALKQLTYNPRIIIWLHGFEAEPWYSRYYNYLSSHKTLLTQLDRKDTHFEDQKEMLRDLFTHKTLDITFIYVSESFKKKYVDPYVGIEPKKYEIIPNIIDKDLFPYRKKIKEDRFKICNIRPYTAKNYANDITRDVILYLSKKRIFKKLEFNLYGDGPLFDQITMPLKQFDNVHLHKGFVPQNEIPYIHAQHGIYLGPTRHDSQGVSLGEAMSSGLVPISNDIGAIKEYIEPNKAGIVVPRDDVKEMANAIVYLVKHHKEFLAMSEYAHESIQSKAGKHIVINKEVEVINGGK